jgi:uncharacterized membrane protein YuzA (DUF378 family)
MRAIEIVTFILVIVGGLNWLLVGIFQFDLVAALFGGQSGVLARVVYVLVGVSAIFQLFRVPSLFEDRPSVHGSGTGPR